MIPTYHTQLRSYWLAKQCSCIFFPGAEQERISATQGRGTEGTHLFFCCCSLGHFNFAGRLRNSAQVCLSKTKNLCRSNTYTIWKPVHFTYKWFGIVRGDLANYSWAAPTFSALLFIPQKHAANKCGFCTINRICLHSLDWESTPSTTLGSQWEIKLNNKITISP